MFLPSNVLLQVFEMCTSRPSNECQHTYKLIIDDYETVQKALLI